jgi:hypothetical protein
MTMAQALAESASRASGLVHWPKSDVRNVLVVRYPCAEDRLAEIGMTTVKCA